MHPLFRLLFLLVWLLTNLSVCQAQDYDDDLSGVMTEDSLAEGLMDEDGPGSIIIDVTRTKIGRDFFDSFYLQWISQQTPARVAAVPKPTDGANARPDLGNTKPKTPAVQNDFIITIEDLPTPGTGLASVISIVIDNETVWQQFVPARRDAIDDYALDAVEAVRFYFADLQAVQAQLGTDDQLGTGLY